MADCMTFPDTVEEFMEQYKVVDTDGIYMSKGAELVPIFRMRQWFEHLPSAQPEIIRCGECQHYSECEIFGKKITLCKRREYDSIYTEPDDFCSRGARREDG